MNDAILTALTQFGAAGLIGLLWVVERRAAAARERQLDEAHRSLMNGRHQLSALLAVIKENTRAIKALEFSQRRLIELLCSDATRRDQHAPCGTLRGD